MCLCVFVWCKSLRAQDASWDYVGIISRFKSNLMSLYFGMRACKVNCALVEPSCGNLGCVRMCV